MSQGVCEAFELTVFIFVFILYIEGVGINPGRQTVYHMCKTWLQKVHGGWDMGGVTLK